jgi:flagellar basal-body rod protein FlgB
MKPVFLFDLVNQNRQWLSVQQSLGAQNIANANTPGYLARDVVPFAQILDKAGLEMSGANPMHIKISATDPRSEVTKDASNWEVAHSGNSVSLEREMMKLATTRGAFSLDTGILKAFHGMWLSSVRG